MWYKKQNKNYEVFHGTQDINSILNSGFLYRFTGQGADEYGPGFYFTTSQEIAHAYSLESVNDSYNRRGIVRPGDKGTPGIIKAKVNLNKPIKINASNSNHSLFKSWPILNREQVKQMIELSLKLEGDSVLENWGDPASEKVVDIINKIVKNYINLPFSFLLYDFFKPNSFVEALRLITKMTGYDGVIIKSNNTKNFIVVAWYSEQIQIIKE